MNNWRNILKDDRYNVDKNIETIINLWENTDASLKSGMFRNVTAKEQEENAKRLNVLLVNMNKHMKAFPHKISGRRMWRDRTEKMLSDAMDKDVMFQLGMLPPNKRERLLDAVGVFVQHTREFDRTLALEAFGQALRNYFVYFMLCLASGQENWFQKGIWGYSLLYPYTDNYMDSEKTISEKMAFNDRLENRLTGAAVLPADKLEKNVFSMIEAIELTYPREHFGTLYDFLLIIYDAQVKSLLQQEQETMTEKELIRKSVYKGGASVYVDQCLMDGCLKGEDMPFLTAFGFFLQLADDLLDIEEDDKNGHQTYMTRCAQENKMEEAVGRLLGFLAAAVEGFWTGEPEIKGFVLENCLQLVLMAVLQNPKYFSSGFTGQLLEWSVLPSEFCKQMPEESKKLMEGFRGGPMEMLDAFC